MVDIFIILISKRLLLAFSHYLGRYTHTQIYFMYLYIFSYQGNILLLLFHWSSKLQMPFQHPWFLSFMWLLVLTDINLQRQINGYLTIKPFLHSWNKLHSVIFSHQVVFFIDYKSFSLEFGNIRCSLGKECYFYTWSALNSYTERDTHII